MKKLSIADNLQLPVDVITQPLGILAVRGAGKTNCAAVLAETMHGAGLPFVVIDPVGSWFGLRSSGDGKGPGLPIPIFGGRHGDVPLEKSSGQLLADLVVDKRLTCVLDLSEFSEGDKIQFLIGFAERLYRRNTDPLHLFLEEADDFIPQRPFREQARLLRCWENIVRRGRARGLGMTMITQRSAALNKNVLTQIETLIVLRTTSPQDRKAIAAWVEYHGQAEELLESLPGLENGEAWVWSPSWLRIMQRVKVHRRQTFDSGATPRELKGQRPPATLADVDLAAVRVKMQETIDRAKQEDPKELRKEIADLKRQLRERPAEVQVQKEIQRVEVPVLKNGQLDRTEKIIERTETLAGRMLAEVQELKRLVQPAATATAAPPTPPRPRPQPAPAPRPSPRPAPAAAAVTDTATPLSRGERLILIAAAQHPGGVTREQLTVLTGYKRSTRDKYLQTLGQRGFIEAMGGNLWATDAGVTALGNDYESLPTGDGLRAYWLQRLGGGERNILEELCAVYPETLSRSQIDERTGYQRSTRDKYLQMLMTRKLVEAAGAGMVRASGELFG